MTEVLFVTEESSDSASHCGQDSSDEEDSLDEEDSSHEENSSDEDDSSVVFVVFEVPFSFGCHAFGVSPFSSSEAHSSC